MIDSEDRTYTVAELRKWKYEAEARSARAVLDASQDIPAVAHTAGGGMADASRQDLQAFRDTGDFPVDAVELALAIEGVETHASPSNVASLLLAFRDFVLVAPPGAGKSVTMFQIAEKVMAGGGQPIFAPLAEWSPHTIPLLDWIVRRKAFSGLGLAGIQAAMGQPGVVLLLDGWNELDETSRNRARTEIVALRRDYPDLRVIVSTRQHAVPPPVNGTMVRVRALDETQQFAIARARRGAVGADIVDRALRTSGIRELIAAPLYLTALLDIASDGPLPETKEELLRRFVQAHERDPARVDVLTQATEGCHAIFMESLAAGATHAANTAISETFARSVIVSTQARLIAHDQLAVQIQPTRILTALASHHLLLHPAAGEAFRFQHQQFQEWFASREVERQMVAAMGSAEARAALRQTILNIPAWEEPVLFACERMSRGDTASREACAAAIRDALEIDPVLAADMIQRSAGPVWEIVQDKVSRFIRLWHRPGQFDRAFLFMARCGRSEFSDLVWPLVTKTNGQTFRSGQGFQISVLGPDAAARIASLPGEVRRRLMWQLSMDAGVAGLDLIEAVGKAETDPALQAEAAFALDFRVAQRHVEAVLRDAPDATYDRLVRRHAMSSVEDPKILVRLDAALGRATTRGTTPYDRLMAAIEGEIDDDMLATIVSEVEFKVRDYHDPVVGLIHRAHELRPNAVANGLIMRVRAGAPTPHWASKLVANSDLSLEADDLVELARTPERRDNPAEVALAALGPSSVARLLDVLLTVQKQQRHEDGSYNQGAGDYYNMLQHRLQHIRPAILTEAVLSRSGQLDADGIYALARILQGDRSIINHSDAPYPDADRERIVDLAAAWSQQLLAEQRVSRGALAAVASLALAAPLPRLLPFLVAMLDAELRGFRADRAAAGRGPGLRMASTSYETMYMRAFSAIRDASVPELLEPYLIDEEFGAVAAVVIRNEWLDEYLPPRRGLIDRLADYSGLASRKASLRQQSDGSSPPADRIFRAVSVLMAADDFATNAPKRRLAVRLGVVASVLPHGQWRETIEKLLVIADTGSRGDLLAALAWSGETLDSALIRAGVEEVLEAARTHPWMLSDNQDRVRIWIELLAFSDNPSAIPGVLATLPEHARSPWRQDGMVTALGHSPAEGTLEVLYQLAAADPQYLGWFGWQHAIVRKDPLSAGRKLIDLIVDHSASGQLEGEARGVVPLLSQMIAASADLRREVRQRLATLETPKPRAALFNALLEAPTAEDLLLFVRELAQTGHAFPAGRWRPIEKLFTREEPVEGQPSTYTVHAVAVRGLRADLLALTGDGGAKDAAAKCLSIVDDVRDEYGVPSTDPRHPDLQSGRPWPIVAGYNRN